MHKLAQQELVDEQGDKVVASCPPCPTLQHIQHLRAHPAELQRCLMHGRLRAASAVQSCWRWRCHLCGTWVQPLTVCCMAAAPSSDLQSLCRCDRQA